MRLLICIIVLIQLTEPTHAKGWLCTQTASKQIGPNEYLVCGTAVAPTESEARGQSFENAILEFRGFCQNSARCRTRQANFAPRRTSCEEFPEGFKCYRAVHVSLGPTLKSLEMTDAELEREIQLRKKRLRDVNEGARKLKKLKALEKQKLTKASGSELENAEINFYEARYKALSYEPLLFKRVSFGVSNGPIENINLTTWTINGGYEYLMKPYLRFNGVLGYVNGYSGEKLGASNSQIHEHELSGLEAQLSVGYSFAPYWLDIGVGYLGGVYRNYGLSSSQVVQLKDLELNQPFYNVNAEYEREVVFFTFEYRGYLKNDLEIKGGGEVRLYIGGKW